MCAGAVWSSATLGEGWHVIEEGLNGRTTVRDDMCHLDTNLNGIRALPMMLEAHKPLDAIVIMLGTNDCKTVFSVGAADIADGAMALIRAVHAFPWTEAAPCPRILLMAPIKIKPQIADVYMTDFDEHSVEASEHFAEYYAYVAEQFGCDFLNAADFAEPGDIDYLHMMPESHELGPRRGSQAPRDLSVSSAIQSSTEVPLAAACFVGLS